MGNPFLSDCAELLVLDSRNCCSEDVVATIQSIEELGRTQYHRYYSSCHGQKVCCITVTELTLYGMYIEQRV